MAIIDDINIALRDHVRYTSANLPVGDPTSGVHDISKYDLRAILIAVLQATGNPDALDNLNASLVALAQAGDTFILTADADSTANAVTATKSSAQSALTIGTGKIVALIWPITNTAIDPTVTIGTTTLTVRRRNGGAVEVGELIGGRLYMFFRANTHLRLLSSGGISDTFGLEQVLADLAAGLSAISTSDVLLDGSARLISLMSQSGANLGDIMRITPQGILALLDPGTADDAFAKGSADAGGVRIDGSRVTRTLNGLPLELLRPDGLDFVPSASFLARLIAAGIGGGGLTAEGWATAPDGSYTVQAAHYGVHAVERVIRRSDGVAVATPTVNGVQRRASLEHSAGQSNANVTRLLDGLMTSTAIFPYHTFMLDDMNAFGSGTHRGGMMGWQGVAVVRGSRFIGASEELRATQDFSSIAFSTFQRLDASMVRRVGLVRSSAWGGNRITGASAGQGLWKDSAGAYTQAWTNLLGDALQEYQLLSAQGYLVDQMNINWAHGESHWQDARGAYFADFGAMKGEFEAWAATNLPGVSIHWFVSQPSGSGLRTGSYLGGAWPVRLDMAELADTARGWSNVTVVMPCYWLTFGRTMADVQEDIHYSYRARIWMGEVHGHARREVRAGRAWRCPRMSSAAISGNSVVVDFDSLLPLVIDQTFCKVRPDAGFTIGNGAVVNAVRLTGQRQITVDCLSAPAGSISYAYRSQDSGDVSDEWPIATGAVRDAWEAPSFFDPGKKLVRAALAYQLTL